MFRTKNIALNSIEEVFKVIEENHNLTNGSCGLSIVALKIKLGSNCTELKPILNQLYSEKKIIVREGINHKLIFIWRKPNKKNTSEMQSK